jgi:hypothetical protein
VVKSSGIDGPSLTSPRWLRDGVIWSGWHRGRYREYHVVSRESSVIGFQSRLANGFEPPMVVLTTRLMTDDPRLADRELTTGTNVRDGSPIVSPHDA